jgi:lipoyl(octanoyl) transferase
VLTLGRSAKKGNILAGEEGLRSAGISVHETNRGGDVTYHGPGQLVGYPILKLGPGRQDVRQYVRDLEEVLIRTLAVYGVAAGRIPKWTGVWLGEESAGDARKIAAIGVHFSRWQTSHGFALNVSTDLRAFSLIVPCGIGSQEAGVTTLAAELGRPVTVEDVSVVLTKAFCEVFGAQANEGTVAARTVSCVVLRKGPSGPQVLLLRRRVEKGGFWQPVTGRLEDKEDAPTAARRELYEETGARLDVLSLDYEHAFALGTAVPPVLIRETAFAAVWAGGEVQLSAEHDALEWCSPDEALSRLPFAGLKRAVRKAVERLGPVVT